MKTTNVLIGIVAAAAAGVAIGMLIAPEKGVDLQKRLKSGAQDWMDEISKLMNNNKRLVASQVSEEEREAGDPIRNN